MEGLANAAGHADRHTPLKNYCTGLLLPGERKSVEPMAARLAPDDVRRMHQSLHHLVADAPWNDEEMLAEVRRYVLPSMQKHGPVVAWIVDDTGFPKQGKHSVGVARQYCGQIGKHDNCQAAVSLSVSTWNASLPIAWRLYLPEGWCQDSERRRKAGVPEPLEFQTKPEIAVQQIRHALEQKVAVGVVLADAGYGNGTPFRAALTKLGLHYVVGIESSTTVWEPGQQPLPAPARKPGRGAPPKRLQRTADHQPIAVKQLALGLPFSAWKEVRLAPRQSRNFAFSFRRYPRAPRASRLQTHGTPPGRMALDRMAEERIGTHQILALHVAEEELPEVSGEDRQTPLDHRTGL
jgi:SRSO17 transposase